MGVRPSPFAPITGNAVNLNCGWGKRSPILGRGSRMVIVLTLIHILVCFFLVVVVLLQSGKAADLAGAFGGMGSQTAFGPRGAATALSRATTAAAVIFMITSMTLAIWATRSSGGARSVLETHKAAPVQQQQKAPSIS